MMRTILVRRRKGLEGDDELFKGVSAEHVAEMAMRVGAPRFMLHDLRKMLASVGHWIGFSDAVMRLILNHTPQKSDVPHRHHVGLNIRDVRVALDATQNTLTACHEVVADQH